MDRKRVNSSLIASAGWENGVLEIEFKSNGAIYHYFGVGKEEFQQMMAADSVGRHFKAFVEPLYSYQRIK